MMDDSSVEQLQERVWANPADVGAYPDLGNALMHQKRWEEAVAAWREALRQDAEQGHAEFAIVMAISGPEPLVEAQPELLRFLEEYGKAGHLEHARSLGLIPAGAGPEPSAA